MRKYLFYISELYGFSIVRPLQRAILERGDEVAWFFDNPRRLAPYLRPGEKWLKTIDAVMAYDPRAVFVPGNVVPDFFPGVKVEIFHGFHARKRRDASGHFRIRHFFDLYCTQGPDTTTPFQALQKRHGSFEVAETGWPKMDPLFWPAPAPKLKKTRPVVLLTSTFNPGLSAAPALFETVRRLAVAGRWEWRVNFHPKMHPDIWRLYRSIPMDHLICVDTDDVIPLLLKADVMVSDMSSIISEFMLLHKPVVTFKNRKPGDHLLNIDDAEKLEEAISLALTRPAPLMRAVSAHADHIHPYRDGRSSLRVLAAADQLADQGVAHLRARRSLNLIRRFKIRKRLGYYRF